MGFKMKGWKAFTTKDHSNNKPDGRAGSSAFQQKEKIGTGVGEIAKKFAKKMAKSAGESAAEAASEAITRKILLASKRKMEMIPKPQKKEKVSGDTPTHLKQTEESKHYVERKESGKYGSSGGYKSTEFGKGGRKGDKKHKSITLTKRKDESGKPTYIQTKSRKGKKDKSKVISERKYKSKLARKTTKSIKRGDDTTSKEY